MEEKLSRGLKNRRKAEKVERCSITVIALLLVFAGGSIFLVDYVPSG